MFLRRHIDDIPTGSNKINEPIEPFNQLKSLGNKFGFHLHKYCTNQPNLLRKLKRTSRMRITRVTAESMLKIESKDVIGKLEKYISGSSWERINLNHGVNGLLFEMVHDPPCWNQGFMDKQVEKEKSCCEVVLIVLRKCFKILYLR